MLRRLPPAADFANVNPLADRWYVAEHFRVDEIVVDHYIARRQQIARFDGEQSRITRSGANQIDRTWERRRAGSPAGQPRWGARPACLKTRSLMVGGAKPLHIFLVIGCFQYPLDGSLDHQRVRRQWLRESVVEANVAAGGFANFNRDIASSIAPCLKDIRKHCNLISSSL